MNPSRSPRFRYLTLLAVACIAMLAFTASASAAVFSPTDAPLDGSNFQGGDGNQDNPGADK
ncbi:MAG: hypothetical protein QOJ29_4529, partial [Thermoleophilaceae bacterium]|nr:hypothetical protein [Thermoleophilaceae bacterium]